MSQEVNGFVFAGKEAYEKAKKEAEAIAYLKANSDLENITTVFKLYGKLLEKGTFSTPVGYDFLQELRKQLLSDQSISNESIRGIPLAVAAAENIPVKTPVKKKEDRSLEKLQELYESEKRKKISSRIVIAGLSFIIAGILLVAQFTPYTIFTDYKDKIENQYAQWQQQLEEREADLLVREQALQSK